MTAPPCPSAEALARDPNLCAICGHWCGKKCERPLEWNPRFVAYCVLAHESRDFEAVMRADREQNPGGKMAPFICWCLARVNEWQRLAHLESGAGFDAPLHHVAFDAWLRKQVEETGR